MSWRTSRAPSNAQLPKASGRDFNWMGCHGFHSGMEHYRLCWRLGRHWTILILISPVLTDAQTRRPSPSSTTRLPKCPSCPRSLHVSTTCISLKPYPHHVRRIKSPHLSRLPTSILLSPALLLCAAGLHAHDPLVICLPFARIAPYHILFLLCSRIPRMRHSNPGGIFRFMRN